MNVKRIAGCTAIGLAGAGTGAIVTLAGGAAAASTTTLHVVEKAVNDTYVPVQPLIGSKSQSNRGDMLAFNDPLYFASTGKQAGAVQGTCVQVAPTTGYFYCNATFIIYGKGQITGVGQFDSSGKHTTTGVITGGTGVYNLARGTVKLKALSSTKDDFVFTIVQ